MERNGRAMHMYGRGHAWAGAGLAAIAVGILAAGCGVPLGDEAPVKWAEQLDKDSLSPLDVVADVEAKKLYVAEAIVCDMMVYN